MRFLWSIAIAALLAGCATFGQMEAGLQALMGRPDREAFDVLGYPASKQDFGGDTVYTWFVSQSGAIFLPQTATTSGYVGHTPVYGTTTYSQAVPVNYNCMIKLVASSGGVLKNWEYNGNIGGCAPYIQRLHSYTNSGQAVEPAAAAPMDCQTDSDCGANESCRSRKGGGTECRPKSQLDAPSNFLSGGRAG